MQVEKQATYTLELNGKIFVIENVPARVDEETGEQFFRRQQWSIYSKLS
jgi:YgiT-type zinc finger domain-containing protein